MKVTSVRVRYIQSNRIFCIASVTLDNQLIINDIKVYLDNGEYVIRLPNTEYAEKNKQYSIVPKSDLFKLIKLAILDEIFKSNG
ncbi:MAG: septation protein SpoVG family protein [Clostridia bacterium]|nr:septation protein SpoVG family protein [Clostridia bacterium]